MNGLSQRDPRWADEKLGMSDVTIGGYGCLITDIAMMANEAGDPVTPSELNARLIGVGGYADGNLLIFADVSKATNALTMTKLISCEEIPAPMDEIDARLAAGEMAAVELWFERARKNKHWVLLYGKVGGSYLIADPWDGKLKRLSDYGFDVWSAATIIRRAVFYKLNRAAGQSAINADGVRLRAAPAGKILGQLPAGTPVRIIESGREWTRVAIDGYVASQFLGDAPDPTPAPVIIPPLAPPKTMLVGVNVLNDFGALREAEASGCKFCMVMDGVSEAVNFARAHPDGYAMLRRYIGNSQWGAGDFYDGLGIAPDMPKNLVVTLYNEADTWGFQTDQLEQRMRVETEFVRLARARGFVGIVALMTSSMGTPQFAPNAPEFAETCRLINQYYAPLWNANQIGLDYHAYSPTIEHINNPDDLFWYERRWEGFFKYCGLDPQKGQGVFFGECGLDEMGVGGFRQHGTSAEALAAWMRKFVEAQTRPVVVDGREYPSPAKGGAVFCYGNNGDARWRDGYDVRSLGAAPFKIAGVW